MLDIRTLQSTGWIRDVAGNAHTLIVLVHAWRSSGRQWLPLLQVAGKDPEFDGCDFFVAEHQSAWFNRRVGLADLAGGVAGSVDLVNRDAGEPYRQIVLVGYSLGGLIARAAYLHGIEHGHPWARNVTRMVLLASPNRGLGGAGTPWVERLKVAVGAVVGGRQISEARKGSEFITNLRLEWVSLYRSEKAGAADLVKPEVIQLRGVHDAYVQRNDSNDVTIFRDAKQFVVAGAGHADLADFQTADDEKYRWLRLSILRPIGNVDGEEEQPPDSAPRAVVFQLHGIRDHGGWLQRFADDIAARGADVRVVRPRFGFLPALGFLMPWIRRRRIAWFCDMYTEEVARLATLDDVPFYFVGHSYGTYIFAESLSRFNRMRFVRACFVGSVVRQDFSWSSLIRQRRLEGLRNDCCSLDWPVGVCCRILNSIGFKDLGTGGFDGFLDGIPEIVQYRYIPGNHSVSLTDASLRRSVVDYLFGVPPTTLPRLQSTPPMWLAQASRWAPLVALAGVALLVIAVRAVAPAVHADWRVLILGTGVLSALLLAYV